MSRQYLELGQAPAGEECAQVGTPNYRENAIRECKAYIQAIRNYLGREPDGALLSYKGFRRGCGLYYEVVCYYNESKPESVGYAFRCDSRAPMTWAEGAVEPPGHGQGGGRRR